MTVPLVQNLFHYSEEKNEKFLELYALALLPQIAACSPTDFDWFLEELVMKDLNQQVFSNVVSRLQGLYPCLGITCQDVGSYKNGAIPQCSDSSGDLPDIAGYKAERDVSEVSNTIVCGGLSEVLTSMFDVCFSNDPITISSFCPHFVLIRRSSSIAIFCASAF
jgi:hypothetical protein